MDQLSKWDERFLDLAHFVSLWSKDPSTKTGAVIVDDMRRVISVGYNGFAQGVLDSMERYFNRDMKYKMVVHCERNAMLFAQRSLVGCTLYTWPFLSCSVCASMVIQTGIKRVVAPKVSPVTQADFERMARWEPDFEISRQMFAESGVEVCEYGT